MPHVASNGIRLAYQRTGTGRPVLLIMGSAATGRAWTMHQTGALNRAGYETVTFDNRGIAPSDCPPGDYTLEQMTADSIGLIEALDLGPCHLVGTSLGAMIAQEISRSHPELVGAAVLLATRSRADAFRRAQTLADRAMAAGGVELPGPYRAVKSALEMLSPATLNDDRVRTWLDLFGLPGAGKPAGQGAVDTVSDRRAALREITVPCRVICFTDDVLSPPHLAAEAAEAIPDCDLVEISGCGHLGFLENPEAVNTAIIEFLDKH